MRILLVDDHAAVRRGLRSILLDVFREARIYEASCGQEALRQVSEGGWNIVILDIGLPDMNGMDVLERIKAEAADVPVLMLSVYSEDQYGMRAMKAGASGYLTKAAAPERLVAAVQQIVAGGRYVSSVLQEKAAV